VIGFIPPSTKCTANTTLMP